jgi:cytochrome d ubiquinol oxidase subunit II
MDYELIRIIWWVLIGILFIGFIVMDGHDMGVGMLSLIIGKTNIERRIAINSVAPHWDGNQVWFVTLAAAIFAAWPLIYSAVFSGLYIAMMLILWTLFLRPVAFEYRSKINKDNWRSICDISLFIASFIPPLLFGITFGNILQGLPFKFDNEFHTFYYGNFFELLNPFAIMCGLISVLMIIGHGANYLVIRTEDKLQNRAIKSSVICNTLSLILFIFGGILIMQMDGYIINHIDHNGISNPLLKSVSTLKGAWLNNYNKSPILYLIPISTIITNLLSSILVIKKYAKTAFISSSIYMSGIIFTVGSSMFPFLLPSTIDYSSSLTMWDATSSQHTLNIMFVVALIFTPIVLTYTTWAYKVMNGKLTENKIKENSNSLY